MAGSCPWLLAMVIAVGCGRVGFEAAALDHGADSTLAAPAWDLGSFGPASRVAALSPSGHEHAASMTADLLEVVFESRAAGNDDIWTARRATPDAPWQSISRIDVLSTLAVDSAPQIASDGLTLWFTSGDVLLESTRSARSVGWSPPKPSVLATLIDGRIAQAAPTASQRVMVVQAKPKGADNWDLFVTTRADRTAPWRPLEPLAGINTSHNESRGVMSDDMLSLFFASDRVGSAGSLDVYFAMRRSLDEEFAVTRVAELATAELDADPWLSPDGRTMLFARVENSQMGVYEARR